MRVLWFSRKGDGLPLAWLLSMKGHDARAVIIDQHYSFLYSSLLKKEKKWDKFLTPESVVVFDSPGGAKTAQRLKNQGYRVVGTSSLADMLEEDRGAVLKLVKKLNLPTSDEGSEERAKIVTLVKEGEVGRVYQVNNLTKFLAGDVGPRVLSAGALLQRAHDSFVTKVNELAQLLHNYSGMVSLSLDGEGRVRSVSLHFQYDCIFALDPEFLLTGKEETERGRYLVLLPVSAPPFPFTQKSDVRAFGRPVDAPTELVKAFRIVLWDVSVNEQGEVVTATGLKPAVVCVGSGMTIEESVKDAYSLVEKVSLEDKMYRVDLLSAFENVEVLSC